MEEKELIARIQRGDHHAFEVVFKLYYKPLVVFAYKYLSDYELAREEVQDLFAQFFEKHATLGIHTSLKSHLFQSVRNRCLNVIKHEGVKRTYQQNYLNDEANSEAVEDNLIEQTELEERIHKAIAQLPSQCRKIFEMSRFDSITNQEIADQLNLSKRTVETQISKALRILRESLSDALPVVILFVISWIKNI